MCLAVGVSLMIVLEPLQNLNGGFLHAWTVGALSYSASKTVISESLCWFWCSSHKVTYILLLFRRCDCLCLLCVTRKMLCISGPTNQHKQSEQNSVQKQPAELVLPQYTSLVSKRSKFKHFVCLKLHIMKCLKINTCLKVLKGR